MYSGPTKGRAGINGDEEHPELLAVVRAAFDGNLRKTGTLVLVAKETARLEPAHLSPLLEVGRTVENDGILLRVCNGHDPLATNLVPEDLGVTELRRIDGEDWAGVLGEGDTVCRVGDVLVLCCSGVQSIDGDEVVLGMVVDIEETGSVVSVKDHATAEYAIARFVWSDGDGQVFPGVQIAG